MAKVALVGPKEAPLMPMSIWPKKRPDKKFKFDATPDTGASISIIAENVVRKQGLKVDPAKKIRIKAADGLPMECSGGISTTGAHWITKTSAEIEMKVSNNLDNEVLIAYQDLVNLKVIAPEVPLGECRKINKEEASTIREKLVAEFPDVIRDELTDQPMGVPPVEIKLKEGPIRPIQVTRARPVELHFQKIAYELIKVLEEKKIIEPVSEPTTWVSPAKFVPKANGIDVRLTTNFQQLNKFICKIPSSHLPIP